MIYLDIGLGLYASLLLWGRGTPAWAVRELQKHALLTVYVAVLIAAAVWPLIVAGWLLGAHRD